MTASNIPYTADAAKLFTTKLVGGEHTPKVAVTFGDDNTVTPVSAGSPLPVSNPTALPLPTGAATAALQTTGNNSLSYIDASTASMNISAAATQSNTYSIDTKTPALVSGRVPVDGSGVTQPVDGSGVTQPISAVSLPLPAGAATSAGISALLTEMQLKADLSETQPISAVSLPLPTGAATSAKQPALGAAAIAASTPVNIASDQVVPVSINALNYPNSSGNNSTAQLTSGATFTGTIETVANLQAAQVEVTCDQPYTVIIEQFIDAGGSFKSSKDSDYTFTRAAGQPLNENITLPGNYFRLKVTNNGTATTTTLNINTTFGIMGTGPYSLTNLGNNKTAITEISGSTIPTTIPGDSDPGLPVRPVPADIFRVSFSDVGSGLLTTQLSLKQTGSGHTVAQSAGNLTIASGTTANAETIIRSVRTFKNSHILRWQAQLSQRIVNNNFEIALADIVGELLAYTINSATSVTVTIPGTTLTSANVGQFMNLSVITTGVTCPPGRYAIASVSGNAVTFTVAGWPGSGSGTLTLWGWNYVRCNYATATATNSFYDTQRKGWNSGDTTLTINTTAAPGHVGHIQTDNTKSVTADALAASATTLQFTQRGSRLVNLPDDDVVLYLFIVARNGTTNPASTTTLTLGFVSVELTGNQKVYIAGSTENGGGMAMAAVVSQPIAGNLNATVSGTVTANLGTGGTGATSLGKAEDAVAASGDTGVPIWGVRRDALTTSASAAADYNEMCVDRFGAQLVRTFEKHAKSYRCAMNAASLAATPTDIADLFGNATTTVVVTAIEITGIQTTGGNPEVVIAKRSTANSAGTRVAGTAVPLDATDAAASSIPGVYSANPTTGTLVGNVDRKFVPIPAATGAVVPGRRFEFGDKGKGLVLSGTAQGVAVNLNSVTLTGGNVDIVFEWYEY
jgi:hypothetical protein